MSLIENHGSDAVREIVSANVDVLTGASTAMGAYLARPAAPGRYPAVIVGMELFGVTDYIRSCANRLAERGYLAIAPDFYYRSEARAELGYDQAGKERGFELLHAMRRDETVDDVRATMAFLRNRPECNGLIGFVGFSTGGHIGFLAATQVDLTATVAFYPGWLTERDIALSQPEPTLTLTPGIAQRGGRLLLMLGGRDFLISPQQRVLIAAALLAAGVQHEVVVYPEAAHGFLCDDRDSFDPGVADIAWEKTLRFLAESL